MQLRYTASALFLSLFLAWFVVPTAAFAQDDEDLDSSEDLDADEELDDDSEDLDAEEELDADPDAEVAEDESYDEASDDDDLDEDDDFGPPPDSAEPVPFADEVPKEDHGPLAGTLQISAHFGYGLRVAGDKTENLFQEGFSPEVNVIDPTSMSGPVQPTLADEARSVLNRYRINSVDVEPTPNPYATSFGARIGYSLPSDPIYLGAAFSYFGGSSVTIPGVALDPTMPNNLSAAISTSYSLIQFGVEIGLDWNVLDFLVLRPSLGLGAALASTELKVTGGNKAVVVPSADPTMAGTLMLQPRDGEESESYSSTRIYYAPGLSALVPLSAFLVGAEARFIGLSGAGGSVGFFVGATAGVALSL